MEYKQIYRHITDTRAFGVSKKTFADGQTVGISNGIKYLMEQEPTAEQEIQKAL